VDAAQLVGIRICGQKFALQRKVQLSSSEVCHAVVF
jgi:hypothetical protein